MTGTDAVKVPSQRQSLTEGNKNVSDLIEADVSIKWSGINGAVSGNFKQVENYDLFGPEENSGHFFPFLLDKSYTGKPITVQRKGGKAKTQADTEWILRLTDDTATEYDVSFEQTKIAHLTFTGATLGV